MIQPRPRARGLYLLLRDIIGDLCSKYVIIERSLYTD
jgi:hypothetical protein